MGTHHRVLVIDDDTKVLKYVARSLVDGGLEVETAPSGRDGMRLLAARHFDAVVCDLRMPDVDGLQVLDYSRTLPEPPVFVLLTAFGTVPTAVDAWHRGAADFLEKPLEDLTVLPSRLLELVRAHRGGRVGERPVLIGGAWLTEFLERVDQLAALNVPILVTGEVGTGKSAVATEIWRRSPRATGSFGLLHCDSVESRAPSEAPWKAPRYSDGVLVLVEVGELPAPWQADLLQRLQRREAGLEVQPMPRLVALSSRNLWEAVGEGTFRSSLYFALSKHTLELPPLRQRVADLPALVSHFCERYAKRHDAPPKRLTGAALECLAGHPWPGNVLQLENFIERLCVSRPGRVDLTEADVLEELPSEPAGEAESEPDTAGLAVPDPEGALSTAGGLSEAVRQFELALIEHALAKTEGNQTEAAKLLNMRRTTLSDKIRRNRQRDGDDNES